MPYVLDIPHHLPGCLNWSDVPETPEHSAKATRLNRLQCEAWPPIPYVQEHYEEDLKVFPVPTILPDIFQGRWSGSFFVSQRFKGILSDLDSVEHIFQPVDLRMLNGAHYPEGYYALGVGCRVEAIDAENSEVQAKSFNGTFSYYVGAVGEPFIQWHGEKISGHHLWMDKHFPFSAFISDELAHAFKKAGITGLALRPSGISGAKGRRSGAFLRQLTGRLRRLRSRRYDALDRLQ